MTAPFVIVEKTGRIVTLTMNRPESRNAIASHVDCEELIAAIEAAEADSDVSVLILTGAGSAFSAGGDLRGMRDRNGIGPLSSPAETRSNYRRGVQRVPLALARTELTTIAAINGHAIGLGCDLACLCDMRVASDQAKFAASFVKIGIVPGDGGAWILPRAVGSARAAELMLTGDTVTAAEALGMGLVNRLAPQGEVLRAAEELAARVVVNPPRTLRLAKRLMIEARHARFEDVLELSAAFQALAHETRDHREALDAFFEKRPANFTGA
jgi:enoyl-CoA hydratase/carnithine racemase